MKKLVSLLLCLVVISPLLLPWADAEEALSYTAVTGEIGEAVDVVFTVTANPNQAVIALLEVEYDHDALELIPGGDFENANGRMVLSNMQGIAEGQEIKASFRILNGAAQAENSLTSIVKEMEALGLRKDEEFYAAIKVHEAVNIQEKNVTGLKFSYGVIRVDFLGSGSNNILSAAEIDNTRVPYGFSKPIEELEPLIQQVFQGAKTWSLDTVPKNLKDFPIMPDGWENICKSLKQCSFEVTQNGDYAAVSVHVPDGFPYMEYIEEYFDISFSDEKGKPLNSISDWRRIDSNTFVSTRPFTVPNYKDCCLYFNSKEITKGDWYWSCQIKMDSSTQYTDQNSVSIQIGWKNTGVVWGFREGGFVERSLDLIINDFYLYYDLRTGRFEGGDGSTQKLLEERK